MYPRFAIGASARNVHTRAPTLWQHGPVLDAELFCKKRLDEAFEHYGMFLRPSHYDDSLQELIIILQGLERKYDPERTDTFERYAGAVISKRAIDVGPRRVLGRNGSRIHDYVFADYEDFQQRRDQLGESFGAWEGDQVDDCGRDERWVRPGYDRQRARAIGVLGIREVGGAAA